MLSTKSKDHQYLDHNLEESAEVKRIIKIINENHQDH